MDIVQIGLFVVLALVVVITIIAVRALRHGWKMESENMRLQKRLAYAMEDNERLYIELLKKEGA